MNKEEKPDGKKHLGEYKLDSKANYNQKDVKSNELSEGMVIQAVNGGNPNKNLEDRDI